MRYCKVITSGGSCLTLNNLANSDISQEEFDARMDHVCNTCASYVEPRWGQRQVDPRVVNINGEDVIARTCVDEY